MAETSVVKFLDSHLGRLRNRELALITIWAADDVGKGNTLARARREELGLDMRLHRCESWSVVLQRQAPNAGQLISRGERAKARRVRRCRNRGVIRRGR